MGRGFGSAVASSANANANANALPGLSRKLHWPMSAMSSLLSSSTRWLRFSSTTPAERTSCMPSY